MKNWTMMLALSAGLSCLAGLSRAQSAPAVHGMLQPDSATLYYDEQHLRIDGMEFSRRIGAGHCTFVPQVIDGRVVSMELKPVAGILQLGALLPGIDFTAMDGKRYSGSSLKGKTVVLNFWFTHCGPCREEMPELNALVKKYGQDNGIVFIAITYDNAATVREFLSTSPFAYSIVTDQADLIRKYGIGGYPTNVLLDKNGRVAFMLTAYAPDNIKQLDAAIAATGRQKL